MTQPEVTASQGDYPLTPEQQSLLGDMKRDVHDDNAFTEACELAEKGDVHGAMKALGQIDEQSTQLKLSAFGANEQEIIANFRNRKHDDGLDCSQYIAVTEHPEIR